MRNWLGAAHGTENVSLIVLHIESFIIPRFCASLRQVTCPRDVYSRRLGRDESTDRVTYMEQPSAAHHQLTSGFSKRMVLRSISMCAPWWRASNKLTVTISLLRKGKEERRITELEGGDEGSAKACAPPLPDSPYSLLSVIFRLQNALSSPL